MMKLYFSMVGLFEATYVLMCITLWKTLWEGFMDISKFILYYIGGGSIVVFLSCCVAIFLVEVFDL